MKSIYYFNKNHKIHKLSFIYHDKSWVLNLFFKEREVLLSHMEQAQDLQGLAEKEADQALDHLEDFITEQESLVTLAERNFLKPCKH